jgi:hypothetical protein
VVYVQNGDGTVFPVYFNEDFVIIDTLFINNGKEIAILMLEGFDPENPPQGNQAPQWVAVDRTGHVRTLTRDVLNYSQMVGAPDGFAFLTVEYPESETFTAISTLTLNADGEESVIWTAGQGFWAIVGHAPLAAADGLTPFVTAE